MKRPQTTWGMLEGGMGLQGRGGREEYVSAPIHIQQQWPQLRAVTELTNTTEAKNATRATG